MVTIHSVGVHAMPMWLVARAMEARHRSVHVSFDQSTPEVTILCLVMSV